MAGSGSRSDMRHLLRHVFRDQTREPLLTLGLLRQHWPGVVGPELAARTRPHRLEGSTLWIAAPDACWAYELQFFKPELLASVQAFLESRTVNDLRFRVVEGEGAPAGPGAATQPPMPAPSAVPAREAQLQMAAQPAAPPAETQPTASEEPRTAPGEPAEAPAALARAAEAIGDPGLRAVFQRSLAKQRRARESERGKSRGE